MAHLLTLAQEELAEVLLVSSQGSYDPVSLKSLD